MKVKTQPSQKHKMCLKCSGTGAYIMGYENGRPYSRTGFTCYSCNGLGWKAPVVRRKRCKVCKKFHESTELRYTVINSQGQTYRVCDGQTIK